MLCQVCIYLVMIIPNQFNKLQYQHNNNGQLQRKVADTQSYRLHGGYGDYNYVHYQGVFFVLNDPGLKSLNKTGNPGFFQTHVNAFECIT